jgi:enolase-phosphatase E1
MLDVVLDIEGTTSSTGFVHATLYPYSRARFGPWLAAHRRRPDVVAMVQAIRVLSGEPDADDDRVVWWLNHWLDGDLKITPLKALQGWIWAEGFEAGELTAHFYEDVIPALRAWHRAGHRLSIFSSGSVSAQQAWFGHSPGGDLLPLLSHHFDTETIGPKRAVGSFVAIAGRLGRPVSELVFCSDLTAELDAARAAGWHTVGVRRAGDQYFDAGVGDHLAITSFDQLDLSGPAPSVSMGPRAAPDPGALRAPRRRGG